MSQTLHDSVKFDRIQILQMKPLCNMQEIRQNKHKQTILCYSQIAHFLSSCYEWWFKAVTNSCFQMLLYTPGLSLYFPPSGGIFKTRKMLIWYATRPLNAWYCAAPSNYWIIVLYYKASGLLICHPECLLWPMVERLPHSSLPPRFKTDLWLCLCGVCNFSLWLCEFRPGTLLSPHFKVPFGRLIGLC